MVVLRTNNDRFAVFFQKEKDEITDDVPGWRVQAFLTAKINFLVRNSFFIGKKSLNKKIRKDGGEKGTRLPSRKAQRNRLRVLAAHAHNYYYCVQKRLQKK